VGTLCGFISVVAAGAGSLLNAADYVTPRDVVLPPEAASQESLNLASKEGTLRFAGIDVFPRASATVMYDDNLLISNRDLTNTLSDVQWVLSPGLTLVAGDAAAALPGSITLDQLRSLLNYSLVDDASKPQRFIGIDLVPNFNLFTDHDEFNIVDYFARLSAGYKFSKLALGLDQDFARSTAKENSVGSRVTTRTYLTRLKSKYDISDRTSVEVNGGYSRLDYETADFQGYQDFRNEDWLNRQLGEKLTVGVGGTFGYLDPQGSASQTYEQGLVRASYRLTGKIDLRASGGFEFRQYDSGISDTLNPVFSLSGIYQLNYSTTITLEAHRRVEASPFSDYNYEVLGFYAGLRKQFFGRVYAGIVAGYDNLEYVFTSSGEGQDRSDNFFSGQVNLEYELNRRWSANLFYIYRQDDSSQEQFSYNNNMVGLQVLWKW